MPGLQDFPIDPQRAWQRHSNPVRMLHLVLEFRKEGAGSEGTAASMRGLSEAGEAAFRKRDAEAKA